MPEMIDKYWAGQSLALDIAEMEFEKAFTAYEYTRDINAKYAELKVMAEGGTEDDLFALYSEAAAEGNEEKKGIFKTFIEKIVNIFRSIGQKISSFFSKKVPAEKKEIAVSAVDTGDFNRSVGKFRGLVGNFVGAVRNNSLTEKIVDAMESEAARLIGCAVVSTAVTTIGGHAVKKVRGKNVNTTAGAVQDNAESVSKESGALGDLLNKLKDAVFGNDEQASLIKRGLNAISNVARAMGSAAANLMRAVANALSGKKGEDEGTKALPEGHQNELPEGNVRKDDTVTTGTSTNKKPHKTTNTRSVGSSGASSTRSSARRGTVGRGATGLSNVAAVRNRQNRVSKEGVDDVIDVSTDEGMLAFEAMLDKLVDDDIYEETTGYDDAEHIEDDYEESVDEYEGQAEDGDEMTEESAMSEEEEDALDAAYDEFNELFN